jgi:hypothetical protein
MARKPTEFVQLKLRIRETLRRKLERAAEKKGQSANAEAVERIAQTFADEELWEARYKNMEERQDEMDERHARWIEEKAREEAAHEAALRDSVVLQTLVGGDENARLLRVFILGMGNNPGWAATPEGRKILADKVHDFIVSADLNKGATP